MAYDRIAIYVGAETTAYMSVRERYHDEFESQWGARTQPIPYGSVPPAES